MTGDAADINRTIFNDEAAQYDNKHRKLNERLTHELQARLNWIGVNWVVDEGDESDDEEGSEEVDNVDESQSQSRELTRPVKREIRLLDYACGTGMMSRALAAYTTQCVGLDISEKMVAAYNLRAENQGLSHKEMHAVLGDLAAPTVSDNLSSPDFFNFDIAVVGGGFHHFGDPDLAAKRLVERLKPGGVLLIWDFLPHGPLPEHEHKHSDAHDHGHSSSSGHSHHSHANDGDRLGDNHGHGHHHHSNISHSVMHHGFSEERMREIFAAAGASGDFDIQIIGTGISFKQHQQQQQQQSLEVIAEHEDDAGQDEIGEGKGKAVEKGNGGVKENIREKKQKGKEEDGGGLRREVFFARGTKA
ncbi:S-adenosyl-L-methionine-dependent methyltransferase [Xylariaceae sp. FL0255]|nr:S-adenosyl-L-methionine-dependent methyltransferase [Xylariaceae sp. FL0255]